LRILHVIQDLRTGGAERLVLSLAAGSKAAGHAVAVAAGPGPLAAELHAPLFPLPMIRRRPWMLVPAARALRRALRAWKPDVVHCHNPGVALAAALATGRRRRGALVSMHGTTEEDYRAASRALRLAGLPVVACGPGVAAALAEHGLAVDATISNGVGPPPPAADRPALLREWGLAERPHLVVAVGRLIPEKNHALAVRALALLPDTNLAIVGEGPQQAQLEQLVRETGVVDRVALTGLRSDARAIMGCADVVVVTSHAEGLPLVALEALAAHRPLVATEVRGLRDVLSHGEDALLVPGDDAEAMAAAVREVLADEELRERLATGAVRVAAAHSEAGMIERFHDLYAGLAQR
jgi:glycosyltransferase involved in cell wall biosynthesis